MRFILRILMLMAVAVVIQLPASAQIATTGPAALARQMPTIYAPYLANISRVKILQKQGKLRPASGGSVKSRPGNPPGTPRPSTPNPPATTGTTFTSVSAPFVPQQLSKQLGKTPQERQYIEGVLTTCLNHYTDSAQQKGVPLNDVARAINYYLATSYNVYTNGAGPTQSQMDATRASIKANLMEDDSFRQMTDRQKQEAYETLIVLAGFVDLGYGTSKQNGNDSSAAQFRDMAKYNLETLLGVPAEKIKFTDAGLTLN